MADETLARLARAFGYDLVERTYRLNADLRLAAKHSLPHVTGIQIEAPLVELYRGEMLFRDTLDRMGRLGFALCSLEYGFADPVAGHPLEADCIFFRDEARPSTGERSPARA